MVISTPTYHIVANIVPPEAGGPLQIGTIIDSLQELIPLNEGEEIKLPHERFFCFHEESFEATRGQITNGSGGIGAKLVAWQIPVGAEVSGEGETSADDTFNAKSLDTSFVYPTKADYTEAVKSTQLQEYLQTANYPPVYIITGMKIAREPSMTLKRGEKSGGQGQLGFNMGDRSNVGIRGDGSHARNTSQTSKKATDMVLAIRVRKLSYKKRYHIVGQRQWSDRAHDGGAELVGKERSESSSRQEPEFEIDELEMDNKDLQGSFMEEGKEADGEHITWVFLEEVHQARIKWAVSTVVPQPERCRSFES